MKNLISSKMTLAAVVMAAFVFSVSLSSCNGCTEAELSRQGIANIDLDGDGDYGDVSGHTANPSFKGSSNSCNIPSHHCPGFVPTDDDDYVCANCLSNANVKCHKVKH